MKRTVDNEPFDIMEASIDEVLCAYKNGRTTTLTLVKGYLDRIEQYDDELNAVLTINPAARSRAAKLDETLESDGFVGPLHGIPIILKDNHDTEDLPTTAGSKALEDSMPPEDAFVVSKLREAGGIVLAKANLHELSYGVDTISSLGGITRNAYDLDRRPSGSSGGTAAAVAANFGTVGTGTDTCSSVRSPPAFNNLIGIRPTRGLVSRSGIVPLSETQDTAGPITRTVADAARMLSVMTGYDSADPATGSAVENIPVNGYGSYLDKKGLEGARIGIVRSMFSLADESNASEATVMGVTNVVNDAIADMDSEGATIVDPVEPIEFEILESARVIKFEFKRDFDRYLDRLGDSVPYDTLNELLETGQVDETVAKRIRDGGSLDIDVQNLEQNVEYLQRLRKRQRIEHAILDRMADRELDALLYPPSTIPPVKIPNKQPFEELHCELSSHTGLPAIVVPAGFTDEGLPVGIELLGRRFGEPKLFELAYSYEQATKHRRPPSMFGPLQ